MQLNVVQGRLKKYAIMLQACYIFQLQFKTRANYEFRSKIENGWAVEKPEMTSLLAY